MQFYGRDRMQNILSGFVLFVGVSIPFYVYLYCPNISPDTKVCDEVLLHKDAKSALNRTKTTGCRNEILEVACKSNIDLYPEFIQSQVF